MIRKLIKRLPFENGELYAVRNNRRFLLAGCTPVIEIYSHETAIPRLGASAGVRSYRAVLAICGDMDYTRRVDAEYIEGIDRFELTADIQRRDGVFERMSFNSIEPNEIDLFGDWIFDVQCERETISRLLKI